MVATQQEFSNYYGLNQGTVNMAIHAYDVEPVGKIQGKNGARIYNEKELMLAMRKYYQHEAKKLRDKAIIYDDKANAIMAKFEKHYMDKVSEEWDK